jgi:MFS family permease
MTGFALTIHVYLDTGSVTRLAMMMLAVSLPGILLAPAAGVWIDRLDRRVVMLVADGVAGLGTLLLAILVSTDLLAYWHIVTMAAVSSAAGAFQEPAYRAALPTLVESKQLGRANGLVELAPSLGTLVAPAIAGGLLVAFGLGTVLLVDFVTFLAAVVTLGFVRFPELDRQLEVESSVRTEFLAGLAYLRERRGLLGFLWIAAGLNLVLTLANVLWVPVFLSFTNEATLGTVMSLIGFAMVAGSVVMGAWGGPKRRVAGALTFIALGGASLAVAGLRPSLWLASAGALGLMFTVPIVNGTLQAMWQTKVHLGMQGRVFSTRRMIATIATPIAFVSAGPLADGVFEPLLLERGALVNTLGPIFGTGPGRGSALLITLTGLAVVAIAAIGWLFPSVRNIERDIPDVPPVEQPTVARV